MNQTMIVIEDDLSISEILSYYFNSVGFDVKTFESGEEYFEVANDITPDIFILDIMLPKMDGFTILETLRSDPKTENTPILLLTARGSEEDRIRGLVSGGDDYIVKPFSIKELHARVGAVMRRFHDVNSVLRHGDLIIDTVSHEASICGVLLELTNKEFDLLTTLLKNRGKVFSREDLLSLVWGFEYSGKTRTVDMHIKSLRSKLNEDAKNPKYIATVHGLGYKVI